MKAVQDAVGVGKSSTAIVTPDDLAALRTKRDNARGEAAWYESLARAAEGEFADAEARYNRQHGAPGISQPTMRLGNRNSHWPMGSKPNWWSRNSYFPGPARPGWKNGLHRRPY